MVNFYKGERAVTYDDGSGNTPVGNIGRNLERTVDESKKGEEKFEKAFVWSQTPLRLESDSSEAFGMSVGLHRLLNAKDVDAVYIQGHRVPFDEIDSKFEVLDPKEDDRIEHATEPQYIIRPRQ